MNKHRKLLIICFLICSACFANQTAFADYSNLRSAQTFAADKFFRTELYFGTDKPGGGKVTLEDWDKFLETEVTPRFPDGFTVLEGYGQYKDSGGKIVREASFILVIYYPKKQREAVSSKIEELREKYKQLFKQESVLRVDFLKSVNVKF
jgi:hypothetical protein